MRYNTKREKLQKVDRLGKYYRDVLRKRYTPDVADERFAGFSKSISVFVDPDSLIIMLEKAIAREEEKTMEYKINIVISNVTAEEAQGIFMDLVDSIEAVNGIIGGGMQATQEETKENCGA